MKRLSDHILIQDLNGSTVQVLPWRIDSVVSVQGSFATPVDHSSGEGLLLDLLAAMLDKGTKRRNKSALYDQLELTGASIAFSSSGDRLDFQVRCLARDLQATLALVTEQVAEPALLDEELALVKGRTAAHLARQASDPAYMCGNRISRTLYSQNHPSYQPALSDVMDRIESTTTQDLRNLHDRSTMFSGLRVAIVGDVPNLDPADVASALIVRPNATEGGFSISESSPPDPSDSQSHHIEIPDRPNLNVMLGHPVDLTTSNKDYLALWTAVFILGGNFSSRLMSQVRDEKGLTYGIRSYLSGMSANREGAWVTSVTLSQDKLEEGIAVTRDVITNFVENGVSSEELAERKQTMIGSYEVELATTSGVAGRLLLHMNRGWEAERVDSHPERVSAIQTDEVNGAINRMLDARALSLVTAGSLS